MTYIQGFIVAVPTANKDAYVKHAADAQPLFAEFGTHRMVEAWGDDVPHGEVTDFRKAVQARDDEAVLFSWFEYPDKATRDSANARMMADPRMAAMGKDMPFDGSRMIYAGFDAVIDDGSGKGGYIDGIVLPVPADRRDDYVALSTKSSAMFRGYGALRVVEGWGDDVPDGKVTDFRRAVNAESGETVVYSFIEWPDKETRDAGWSRMMSEDPLKGEPTPFDGKRMFWGGFRPLIDA